MHWGEKISDSLFTIFDFLLQYIVFDDHPPDHVWMELVYLEREEDKLFIYLRIQPRCRDKISRIAAYSIVSLGHNHRGSSWSFCDLCRLDIIILNSHHAPLCFIGMSLLIQFLGIRNISFNIPLSESGSFKFCNIILRTFLLM